MDFLDKQYFETEKERLLRKYNCTSLKEVLFKQEQLMREKFAEKKGVHQMSVDRV